MKSGIKTKTVGAHTLREWEPVLCAAITCMYRNICWNVYDKVIGQERAMFGLRTLSMTTATSLLSPCWSEWFSATMGRSASGRASEGHGFCSISKCNSAVESPSYTCRALPGWRGLCVLTYSSLIPCPGTRQRLTIRDCAPRQGKDRALQSSQGLPLSQCSKRQNNTHRGHFDSAGS